MVDDIRIILPDGDTRLTIKCGWCMTPTSHDPCHACEHPDPTRPWIQRGLTPPQVKTDAAGRPTLDPREVRRKLREARAELGSDATTDMLAEHLRISNRTLGRWQKLTE